MIGTPKTRRAAPLKRHTLAVLVLCAITCALVMGVWFTSQRAGGPQTTNRTTDGDARAMADTADATAGAQLPPPDAVPPADAGHASVPAAAGAPSSPAEAVLADAESGPPLLPASAREPKGRWATEIPAIEDYAAGLSPADARALAEFRRQFPDLDPTEHDHLAEATIRQRGTYGDALDEAEGAAFTAWLQPIEAMQQSLLAARARHISIPVSGSELGPDGTRRSYRLVGFEGVRPIYAFTQNAGASISTNVNLVRMQPAFDPYLGNIVSGTGFYVNVNDHGTIYEHPEFQLPASGGSRIIYKEVYDSGDRGHMTHVAGTVGAWGYTANLTGMAPRVWIRSHIQQSTSDITLHGMMWPGQKHTATNPRNGELEMKSVMGTTSLGSTDSNTNRGVYYSTAASFDSTLRDYPYYSHFYAAVNDGASFATLGLSWPVAKNNFVIGSVSDVTRDANGNYVSGGTASGFSSRGPTFDGRIKPDLTANGEGVTSPNSATGTGSLQGTSMATPNASGTATLLMSYIYHKLPGHFVRSSTVKALFVNTADDRGNTGPDYTYGWGIINVKEAAATVRRYAENPASRVVIEDLLSPNQTWTQNFTYDGSGPIRVTLAWIDPPGVSQSASTATRDPRLINDLDLRLISGNTTYQPFVMPFVIGSGNTSSYNSTLYSANAVTGNNFTDNVEQVRITSPTPGTYTIRVSHNGTLQNDTAQRFSLAVSGLTATDPVAPAVTSVSPAIGNGNDNFAITVKGSGFLLGSDVLLRRAGSADAAATGEQIVGTEIVCRIDTANLTKGYWDVVVRTPDGTEAVLPAAFLLPLLSGGGTRENLYTNDFESGTAGLLLGTGWSLADPDKGGVAGPPDAQQGGLALVTHAGGQYPPNAVTFARLPAISTLGFAAIRLEIQRWLGVIKQGTSTDYARVQYSLDGLIWTELVAHSNLIESAWAPRTYDLPAAAENTPTVYLRFRLETDATNASFGWNIDDLKVTAINTAAYPPVFTSPPPGNATVGQFLSHAIAATDADTAGANLTFTASGLPDGLALLDHGNGTATLSGTPTVSGVFAATLAVADGTYTTNQSLDLRVFPAGGNVVPAITTAALAEAFVGDAYAATVNTIDSDGPALALAIGPKPAWLNFTDHGNGTATLGGTPPVGTNGAFDLAFTVSDSFSTAEAILPLTVRPRATIGFTPPSVVISEAGGNATLTVLRTAGTHGAVTVDYATSNGTATAGLDYTARTGTLSWAHGDSTARTIVIPITQDELPEIDETLTVTLSNLTGIASLGNATGTVNIDDDENNAVAYVEVVDADCREASSNNGTFRVTRTGSTNGSVTVNYTLSGTAINGTDYTLRNGVVTIGNGNISANVVITPTDDSFYEGNETVTLTVTPGIGYNLGDPVEATLDLIDNDKPAVSISASAATVEEDAGAVTLTFTRNGTTELSPVTVFFTVAGNTTTGADYTAFGGSVTIPIFDADETIVVPILNDDLIEGPETLTVNITSNSSFDYITAPSPGNFTTVTVRDDSEPVVLTISASDGSASEPGKSDGNGTFTITRSGNVTAALNVILLPGGNATADSDYIALPASVPLAAGQTSATVTVTPIQDALAEPDETISATLHAGEGYSVGTTTSATVTLYDDEPSQVRVEVSDGKCIEQSSADTGSFLIRRLGNRSNAITVNYTVSGTATPGTDFSGLNGTVTLGNNTSTATLTVTPINDTAVEGPETVTVTLGSGANYTLASPDTATIDIREDETADVTVAVQDATCIEGSTPDNGSFRITRTGATTSPLTVAYSLNGTASNGTDYALLNGTATISIGATTVDVVVAPLNDATVEGVETVALTLEFTGADYDLGDTRSVTLSIRDDETPTITIAATDAAAAEADGGSTDPGQFTITAAPAPDADLTLTYTVSGGTNGVDYAFLPGTILLPAGQTSVTLALDPVDDELNEGTENVTITLLPASTHNVGAASNATVSIAASDTPVLRALAADADAAENPADTGRFVIQSDKIFTSNTNVLYLMEGTATNGADYTTLNGTIQISSGSNTAILTLTPSDDATSEGDETATLTITDNSAYMVGPARSATATIADDEADGSVNLIVTPLALAVPENGTATFTVALDTEPAADLTATVSFVSGDADLSVQSGAALLFTPANWNSPQIVTLAAAVDPDSAAGNATFLVSAPGYPNIGVIATEADKDAPPVIAIVHPDISPVALPDLTNRLVLIAEISDTIGSPTVAWSQTSGPPGQNASFASANAAQTDASFPAAGTYVLRATATDSDNQTATAEITVLAGSAAGNWTGTNLGGVSYEGNHLFSGSTLTMHGAGGDITGVADRGYFFTTPITGNFNVTARVTSLQPAIPGYTLNGWAKAGIAVRESTANGSKAALSAMTPGNGFTFHYRTATDNSTASSTQSGLTAPYWVRMVRTNNSVDAYRSPDGTTWTKQGSTQTINMTNPVLLGFAVSSGNPNSSQPRAVFDNISGLPAANAAPQVNPGIAPAASAGVPANLAGTASDDGQPNGATLSVAWSQVSGPGVVNFADANTAATAATFPVGGNYVLRLTATDGSSTVFEDLAVTLASTNTAPTIVPPGNQTVAANSGTGALSVTIQDAETGSANLTLSATSANQTLAPDANILLGGTGSNRTVAVTPAPNRAGATTITLTVGDGQFFTNATFLLTVTATFDSWAHDRNLGTASAPDDDPDGDGRDNLLEYGLNGDPLDAHSAPGPGAALISEGADDYLMLSVARNPAATDLLYEVEVTGDLSIWNSGPPHTTVLTSNATLLEVRDNTPVEGAGKRFIRLRLQRQ
jgi:hypothetical protein